MNAWKGSDGKYKTNGCSRKTKIVRKPEGVRCELKSAADRMSEILLQLETSICTIRSRIVLHGNGQKSTQRSSSFNGLQAMELILHQIGSHKLLQSIAPDGSNVSGLIKSPKL